MKILIIGLAKIKYMPYLNFYLDNIDILSNEVHLLYWNRDLKEEDVSSLKGITQHEFICYQDDEAFKLSKLTSFAKFRRFAARILKHEKFDFVIVLQTLTGVCLLDILKARYQGRYIFDYRDSTYEFFAPFRKMVANLVKYSSYTFVSSDAFRSLLPQSESDKIITSHNLLLDSLNHRDDKGLYGISSDKIRIVQWGSIRYESINMEFIRKIANDKRFELHYYGREQQVAQNLKEYVIENRIDNVFFHGEYVPDDRYKFILQTDILHNVYFGDNEMQAISNKYYDGIIFKIPQLCIKGSYMAAIAEEHGIGLACDPNDDDFTEKIYRYYSTTDPYKFRKNCDIEVERICSEYYRGCAIIKDIINTTKERLP